MNPLRIAAALVLFCLSSGAALAEEPKGTAADIARLLVPQEAWTAGLSQLAKDVQGRLQSHPGSHLRLPADFQTSVRAELEKVLPYGELLGLHARALSATYSEPELKDLLAFYRSPLGQKWLQVTPELTEKVAGETQQKMEQQMPGVMERLGKLAKAHPPESSGT
ncbi:DUF2059 domain-containing protein [Anaeromyxobacter diazotrophicus]|uniref:DUF2059 domain-containing protein n=1 Tax=Anaeromyxobacter diazotrophicus TaxID=2590199 RepID=A0A7I9VM52_9BACT|nr:DUF2059 domain-containing protein [Anaeromyxobacter diazotrophicus]GEJ57057.1 hypothetical protein AMYX_17980 [Anaeromyxobacter diazotrophicus]